MLVNILFWVSIIAGGLLVLLMLLSLIGGLDLDLDIETGSPDVETDSGGIGLLKGFLTFVSVSSWVVKILIAADKHPGIALGIGIFAGLVAFLLLNYLFKLLLKNESNVNWKVEDALFQKGEVYLKIPADKSKNGIIQVTINGALRELKAHSATGKEIKTGESIRVVEVDGDFVKVTQDI